MKILNHILTFIFMLLFLSCDALDEVLSSVEEGETDLENSFYLEEGWASMESQEYLEAINFFEYLNDIIPADTATSDEIDLLIQSAHGLAWAKLFHSTTSLSEDKRSDRTDSYDFFFEAEALISDCDGSSINGDDLSQIQCDITAGKILYSDYMIYYYQNLLSNGGDIIDGSEDLQRDYYSQGEVSGNDENSNGHLEVGLVGLLNEMETCSDYDTQNYIFDHNISIDINDLRLILAKDYIRRAEFVDAKNVISDIMESRGSTNVKFILNNQSLLLGNSKKVVGDFEYKTIDANDVYEMILMFEEFTDLGNGVYDEGEEFTDLGNDIYDQGEEFIDLGNCIYDEGEEFTDLGNGIYDEGEEFIDANGNEIYDEGEEFTDLGNGVYDEGEEFIDANENEVYDESEEFIDANGNEIYDEGEEFTDLGNGIYDEGEEFTDLGNDIYDEGEEFTDLGNGVYDEGEEFTDLGNGVYDEGEEFIDANGNEIYDESDFYSLDLPLTQSIPCNFSESFDDDDFDDDDLSALRDELFECVNGYDHFNSNSSKTFKYRFVDGNYDVDIISNQESDLPSSCSSNDSYRTLQIPYNSSVPIILEPACFNSCSSTCD